MSKYVDQRYLRTDQYKDAANLSARAQLHERFSTNQVGWQRWVFDQLDLPAACNLLELGCGPGLLWLKNRDRIPEGWEITLSDLSSGMVQEARGSLGSSGHSFLYEVLDAQFIPCADESFDAVIANHMLYHVPDRAQVLYEIRRVLRPGGRLYASTVGSTHLRELADIVRRVGLGVELWGGQPSLSFLLENGSAELSRWFPNVALHRYEDALAITEAEPLVAYVASTLTGSDGARHELEALRSYAEGELARHKAIHVTKDTGMFVGSRVQGGASKPLPG
jgi:2-polyprenyl-3-methyl-5-hydroxy-6-metoxy-1,4-benzoquinol methylase